MAKTISQRKRLTNRRSNIVFRDQVTALLKAMLLLLIAVALYLEYLGIKIPGFWTILTLMIGGISARKILG